MDRADRFFDQKKYREAVLEYRNVVDAEPKNLRALKRLGIAHFELNELGQAFVYLRRASELDPQDTQVRWRLGLLYALSREPQEARRHAEFVLQKEPDNVEALSVLAEIAETPNELDATIARVTEVRGRLAQRERASRLLGMLYLKRGDAAKAEEALQDAVKSAPQSMEAHTALAMLHVSRGRAAEAEKEFRAAADAAPADLAARLRLADFYLSQGRLDRVRQVLTELTAQNPDYMPAWHRLAEAALLEKKYDEADKITATMLEKNPAHVGALLLRAQTRLQQGKTDEAIQDIQRALKQDSKFAPAHYQLGLAHLQAGNEQQARAALKQAITLDPGFAEAAIRLAEMNLQAGAPDPVIDDLKELLKARPGVARAYELMGAAYMLKGDAARAAAAYNTMQQLLPARDPRASYYAGLTLRAQGKRSEARKAFESAMALAPGAPDPLSQLVDMAFEEKRPDVALEVASTQAQAAPRSAVVQYVLGTVHQRRGELGQAEAAYRKAVELDPRQMPARLALAKIYLSTNKPDQALVELDKGLSIDRGNAEGWLLSGVAHERKGDVPKAQEAFQKALAINPRFAPAANNLAWLYSEHGGDPEQALKLAQIAKEGAPDDPQVSDTLGWVLYKRGVYQRALGLLKESAAKLPDNAQVQFHLGMTYYKMGDKPAARQALTRALELNAAFNGADEARRVLSDL
jgi:putative PEP-CTERM system TPR-repeat lipoprotein